MAERTKPQPDELSGTTERSSPTVLVDVREGWYTAPELPFAYQDPENIITGESWFQWKRNINKAYDIGGILPKEMSERYPAGILNEEAIKAYHQLRFLSRTKAQAGLDVIAQDIDANFSPENTLIHIEPGSMRLLHGMIQDKLPDFGTAEWRGKEVLKSQRAFKGSDLKDANWLYIDDWVLSGDQITSSVAPFLETPNRLFTYHLVMSDRGKYIYDKTRINGKSIYKVNGDEDTSSFFGTFPLYGFHKIPDNLSKIYADQARDRPPEWTIFPEIDGRDIGRHSRLMRY